MPIIELFPTIILLSTDAFGAIQQSDPILHFPLRIHPAGICVLSFIFTLCPICTRSSIKTSLLIIVSDKEPFSMETLDPIQVLFPIFIPPTCGNAHTCFFHKKNQILHFQ